MSFQVTRLPEVVKVGQPTVWLCWEKNKIVGMYSDETTATTVAQQYKQVTLVQETIDDFRGDK